MLKLLKYIGTVGIVLSASVTHAQLLDTTTDPLRLVVTPETPGPNTLVNMEVQGIGSFVGDALITWRLNGQTVKSGVGERTYSFTTGALGSTARVSVTVDSPTQGVLTRERTFIPSSVNLIWEAKTYTPPFFRGKALYTPGAGLTITAFPQVVVNGRTLSANSLSFQWSRNDEPVPHASGQGRFSFTFSGDQLRTSETVSVEVYASGTLVGRGSILIPALSPRVVLYPRDPLRGVLYDQALPTAISLGSKEITLEATPFFFSLESLSNGTLTYAWTLNGRSTSGPDSNRGILTLRQSGEGSGSATVGLKLQNTEGTKLLQSAQTGVRILFGEESSGSFFGL